MGVKDKERERGGEVIKGKRDGGGGLKMTISLFVKVLNAFDFFAGQKMGRKK